MPTPLFWKTEVFLSKLHWLTFIFLMWLFSCLSNYFLFPRCPLLGFQVWMSSLSETPKKSVAQGKFLWLGVLHATKRVCGSKYVWFWSCLECKPLGSVTYLDMFFSQCKISDKEELCFSDQLTLVLLLAVDNSCCLVSLLSNSKPRSKASFLLAVDWPLATAMYLHSCFLAIPWGMEERGGAGMANLVCWDDKGNVTTCALFFCFSTVVEFYMKNMGFWGRWRFFTGASDLSQGVGKKEGVEKQLLGEVSGSGEKV